MGDTLLDVTAAERDRALSEVRRLRQLMRGLLVVLVNGELTMNGQRMIAADLKAALAAQPEGDPP